MKLNKGKTETTYNPLRSQMPIRYYRRIRSSLDFVNRDRLISRCTRYRVNARESREIIGASESRE